ncbi:zinc finger protein ZPR1-like [Dendronephthya gigantea]|uniref:zinc finger protein ZPR1-like n=1 Tax=Dendronephthya gigantea TaxID=151771 RepID=UPI00106D5982|nr:zinc finger protein ZPR1-like [Dendronephthya gigantea]
MANLSMFPNISADNDENSPMSVESLCMACEEKGTTKILMTKIPYFHEVVIMSFECQHCGNRNNEINSAGPVQSQGIRIEIKVAKGDLNRQIIKTESAMVKLPELDFEIPAFTQKGELSTIEGVLERAISSLEQSQPLRKAVDPEQAEKVGQFIEKLKTYRKGDVPFTFVLDDISGNSFVENPHAPDNDAAMTVTKYDRTEDQNRALGFIASDDAPEESAPEEFNFNEEVLEFPTDCPHCKCPTNMKAVDIPFFKQVILMATNCSNCGKRSNEVKSGAGIEDQGKRIELKITDPTDLSRDVLKSDTCTVRIPELEFELESGTLGGRFTTLEGLLINVKEDLEGQNPFGSGDTPTLQEDTKKLQKFISKLMEVIEGKIMNIHLILDDPAGNSYLQNVYAPEDDPNMKIVHYERNQEQNEDLGISEEMIAEEKARREKAEQN